jgi:NitT/TauT family transport system substrate-binding protein
VLWKSLYGQYGPNEGGVKTRLTLPFGFTPEAMEHLNKSTAFLFEMKSVNAAKMRPEAVMRDFTDQILKERNLKAPIGDVATLPESQAPAK